jgi:NiFe hydrogenase small subunit HydA
MQAQQALAEAVGKYSGKYICVVEGSIPTRDNGVYMKLAGRPAMEVLADVGGKAAAIVAIGSCAAWGGIPSADPDPTGAVGVVDLMPSQTIVNLPGCPPNPLYAAWCPTAICRLRDAARNGHREAPKVRLRPRYS